jgi:hypothetical protein
VRSQAVSGRTQTRKVGGQRFEFTAKFPPMKRATFAPIDAFIESQEGSLDTFQIVLPVLSDSSGSATGTARAAAAGSVGDSTISVDGFTGTLKAGDVFKWSGHSKVYKVISDRDGAGTLSFFPALVAAVADNEVITYNDVPFTVRLNNDIQEFGGGIGSVFSYELDMIEAL